MCGVRGKRSGDRFHEVHEGPGEERPLGGGEIIDIQDRGAQVAQSGLRLLLDELSHHTLLGPQLRGRARAPRPGAGPQAPVCTHLFAPS